MTMSGHAAEVVRVMTFNIWVGGESGGQPQEQTRKVIQAAKADIVGIQEKEVSSPKGEDKDTARKIAEQLNWNYFDQGDGIGIITHFQLGAATPNRTGTEIKLPSGQRVWMFNVHFAHAPYQPYQLLRIPYYDGRFIDSAADAIAEANQARGDEARAVLQEIAMHVPTSAACTFVTGDFNEPSCLDWTQAAAQAKLCPIAVPWPTTAQFLDAGFQDGYRKVYPDPVRNPGLTWTPITQPEDPQDHHDRIDFVLFRSQVSQVVSASIVGEAPRQADIVVSPYPSDHRSVVCEFTVPEPP